MPLPPVPSLTHCNAASALTSKIKDAQIPPFRRLVRHNGCRYDLHVHPCMQIPCCLHSCPALVTSEICPPPPHKESSEACSAKCYHCIQQHVTWAVFITFFLAWGGVTLTLASKQIDVPSSSILLNVGSVHHGPCTSTPVSKGIGTTYSRKAGYGLKHFTDLADTPSLGLSQTVLWCQLLLFDG